MTRRKNKSNPSVPGNAGDNKNGCVTPALDRGLAVLELLVSCSTPLRAIDMAQELKIPKGSLGRILKNLMDRGYLERDDRTMTFTLTSKLLTMGSLTVCESHLIEKSLDVMRDLRDQTLEMVMIQVPLNDFEGVVLNTIPSRHQIRMMVDPGTHFEFHNTAPGKSILAFLPEKDFERIMAGIKLTRTTDKTITSKDELRRDIEETRERGYAMDKGECVEGIFCVSAPIYDRNKHLAATLTMTGPSTRLSVTKLKEMAPLVIAHANEISRRLGYV